MPQYLIDVGSDGPVWDVALDMARRADGLGLDSIWLSDHPFAIGPDGVPSGALDPLVLTAALARATERVRVGTLVLAASMREPAFVAHCFDTLARGVPGRLVAGVGTGWYEPEHRAFGIPLRSYDERVAALDRTLELVGALSPKPALLCGGTGQRILELAARRADAWNVAWDVPPEAFAALKVRLEGACERAGRDPATLACSVGLTLLVAQDERGIDRAIERLRGRAAFLAALDRDALISKIVCGTPEHCAERIAAYGADEVVAALLLRDDPEMLELFATEVAPLLRA